MIIIEYYIGHKVVFKNLKRLRERHKYKVEENVEYVIIGFDQQDGCPYILVDDMIYLTTKSIQKFIALVEGEPLLKEDVEQLSIKHPYIPKSKATMQLMSQLETQNENRFVDLAIDRALENKNFALLKKLLKMKTKNKE